ncbi:MAG: hypothetical protein K6F26_03415 [Lachnospiraceae bacterium]|nr:hypothetical protein [Lachnospiraceae bacterium]
MLQVDVQELLAKYTHVPDEFPVLSKQTHWVLQNGKIVSERIPITENVMHYVQDTALLISRIAGLVGTKTGAPGKPFDHVIYLDKSARPVSWLVNLFWKDFAVSDENNQLPRPPHSYLNIDRAPWFRNVGIAVNDDGRQRENGELATYLDFVNSIHNLSFRHLAEIRALYIKGGISNEDPDWIISHPTLLDGKRILVVDEVSRTGATLDIAQHLIRLAFPETEIVEGTYFWNPSEPMLQRGSETMLTSLPVWYDPNSEKGRGIGAPSPSYYRSVLEQYEKESKNNPTAPIDLNKLRTHAFSSSVFSAPFLNESGGVLSLSEERLTRELSADLLKLHEEYRQGHIFFVPPRQWIRMRKYKQIIEEQGVLLLSPDLSEAEQDQLRKLPLFYLNFIEKLKQA